MPKQKTKKAIAKRFKKTGTGKIKRANAGRGHLFASKTSKQKRSIRAGSLVAKSDMKRIGELMPR